MKRLVFFLLIIFPFLLFGRQYIRTDSLAVTTTIKDTTFTPMWNGCRIWFDGCDGLILISSSTDDTTGFASRPKVSLDDGEKLEIWHDRFYPGTVYRIRYEAASGSGTLYIFGYKNVYQ